MITKFKNLYTRTRRVYKRVLTEEGQKKAVRSVFSRLGYEIFVYPIIRLMRLCKKKATKDMIVFETKPDYADNGRALSEYMVEHGYTDKYKIVWLVMEPEKFKKYETKNVKFVRSDGKRHKKRTFRAYYYALNARFIMFTHAFKWVGKKPEGQTYVNLWHGCGYKASRRPKDNPNTFDYCLVPGNVFIDTKAVFFNCPKERILPIGYPRYDLYKRDNKNVEKYFESLGAHDENTKYVLWMPTFRTSSDYIYYENPISAVIGLPTFRSILQLPMLDELCREKNIHLIVKKHRMGGFSVKGQSELSNIHFLNNDQLDERDIQLYELIGKTDALLTDYSSTAVDYFLVDKPIGFTLDDYEDYKKTRGFVFEDAKAYMPGEHLYSFEDLEQFLVDVASGIDKTAEKRHEVMKETQNVTDDYGKRILDYFHIEK